MLELNPMHHISLLESSGMNCAWVRIAYGGKTYQQSFTYKNYGGKAKAIAAAKAHRDHEGKKIYGEYWPYVKQAPRRISSLNYTGVIGVSYCERDHSWVATWQEGQGRERRQKNKCFSINKYGDRNAKNKAINFRNTELVRNRIAA